MSHNGDWEYRLYFREWMRQQKFEQDRQDAIWQHARDFPPPFKGAPPQPNAPASRPTDVVFGFLLLAFSGWLGFKVYHQTGGVLFALCSIIATLFLLDILYRRTVFGCIMH